VTFLASCWGQVANVPNCARQKRVWPWDKHLTTAGRRVWHGKQYRNEQVTSAVTRLISLSLGIPAVLAENSERFITGRVTVAVMF
jgi:hypothetical protein